MKPILINMDEMSESTEVYGTRPSPVFAVLIYFLTAALILSGVWMSLFRIDIVTHANGMVRSNDTTATITNVTAGKILEWKAEDGAYVTKGTSLFSIDATELQKQKESCETQMHEAEERLTMLDAYQKVLDGDEAVWESSKDNVFFQEFEARKEAVDVNCDMVQSDASVKQSQYQNSIDSVNHSIETAEGNNNKLSQLLSDVKSRTNSFSSDEVYYYAAAEEYINNYNFTASQYEIQIKELQKAVDENGTPIDSGSKIEELQNQKAQALNQVESEMVASIEQSMASNQSNLETLHTNLKEVKGNQEALNNGTVQLSKDQIMINEKNAVYAESNTYQEKKTEYETTLASLQERIAACEVKAQSDGYLNLSGEKTAGDYVNAGENLGSIIPKEEGIYKTVIYVENQDIAGLKKGQKVKYEIPAYPSGDYGVMEGKITKISKDVKVNEDTGVGYYEVEATISCSGKKIDKKQVKFLQGMAVQAKVVTNQKSVMRYLLEKIDLVD